MKRDSCAKQERTRGDVVPGSLRDRGDSTTVGLCLETAASSETGKTLVRWESKGRVAEERIWAVRGVDCRPGDQVLLNWPENWSEPLLVGVLAMPRPCVCVSEPMEKTTALVPGERLTVCSLSGKELLVVEASEDGSHRLRLSGQLSTWEFEEALRIVAPCIDLCSTEGDVSVTASEEVIIKGSTIRLN